MITLTQIICLMVLLCGGVKQVDGFKRKTAFHHLLRGLQQSIPYSLCTSNDLLGVYDVKLSIGSTLLIQVFANPVVNISTGILSVDVVDTSFFNEEVYSHSSSLCPFVDAPATCPLIAGKNIRF